MSPFEALHGYKPEFLVRVANGDDEVATPSVHERVERLHRLRSYLEQSFRKAQESHQRYYNQTHKEKHYLPKNLVILSTKNLKLKGLTLKL